MITKRNNAANGIRKRWLNMADIETTFRWSKILGIGMITLLGAWMINAVGIENNDTGSLMAMQKIHDPHKIEETSTELKKHQTYNLMRLKVL